MPTLLQIVSLLVLTVLSSAPAISQTSLAPGECEELKKLVGHTGNDFARLKGSSLSEGRWRVSVALPGKRTCYIHRYKRVSYVCESEIVNSQVQALQQRDALLDSIGACLGPSWSKQLRLSEFFVSLDDGYDERSIMLTVEKDTPLPEYYVRTSIQRMNQLPLDPKPQSPDKVRPAGYCPGLKAVILDSRNKFAQTIQGSEKHDFGSRFHWQAAQQLEGWQDCFVHEWNGNEECRYMTCKVGPVSGDRDATTLTTKVSEDIRSCLGSEWRENRTRKTDGSLGLRIVSTNSPLIELSPTKSLYSELKYLDLAIRSQGVCQIR